MRVQDSISHIHHVILYRALGELAVKLSSSSVDHQSSATNSLNQVMLHFVNGLQQFLTRNFAIHKMVVGLVLTFWKGCGFKDQLVPRLMTALTEDGSYEDLMPFLLAMQKDCHVRKQQNTRGV